METERRRRIQFFVDAQSPILNRIKIDKMTATMPLSFWSILINSDAFLRKNDRGTAIPHNLYNIYMYKLSVSRTRDC